MFDDQEDEWRSKALCKNKSVLFFPSEEKSRGNNYKEALLICAECESKRECLEFAIRYEMHHGVWGGTTPNQRRAMIMNEPVRIGFNW